MNPKAGPPGMGAMLARDSGMDPPDADARVRTIWIWQLLFAAVVSIIVVANAAVSSWLATRGRSWSSTFTQFVGMVAINAALVVVYFGFLRRDQSVDEGAAIFFLVLLTFVITLYDRYRPLRAAAYLPIRSVP